MISRAFVESIINDTHVAVRIPRINKIEGAVGATPSRELGVAIINTIPGCSPRLRRGDVVLVGYEDDDEGSPVILGLLFQKDSQSTSDVAFDSLRVNVDVQLPENTKIGNINKESFQMLSGIKENIQVQLDTQKTLQAKTTDLINEVLEKVNQLDANGVAKQAAYYGKTDPKYLEDGVEGQLYIYIEE